ncbi:hypothetical protein PC123_g15940 [Phytophthora cactorum]|nr:hypothetical protein PC120_g15784 [Phytophthora cactorum]KAG4048762.1 hypothetical protein PC123_g15940 [Phytophthora cactorum]
MLLKDTDKMLLIGTSRVDETYAISIASDVCLQPGHQALVRSRVKRDVNDVSGGQVVVEVCNASTEEVIVKAEAVVAVAAEVPEMAFEGHDSPSFNVNELNRVIASATVRRPVPVNDDLDKMEAALTKSREEELCADYSDSALEREQRSLFTAMLWELCDLFVENSKRPGRTDLMEFRIDTGTHTPIKQQPYSVSKTDGDVMEAELQQYLELNPLRSSTRPWASPVLMIRKPDGGIRFCFDY